MKKFLKGVVGYFLGTAMFVYTACIFMEPNLLPVFVLMDAICALILFLIFRKRKPKPAKQKAPPKTEPTVQVHSNLNPERAIKSMPGGYTVAEAKNHVRIVQDCSRLFEHL